MNYEYNGIFDLEDIVLEQECDMLNVLMDLINKNELFIESGYMDNEACDDFINEMFSIYTEATDRNKQQKAIAQYMRDNGYGDPNGNNPSNAKKARRLQNTLLQHDFNPVDETIRSDYINPKDGSTKRVPFRMYDKPTVDQRLDGTEVGGDAHFGSSKLRGSNDYNQHVNIPSKEIKQGSQSLTQFKLHHELGHHKSQNAYTDSHNTYGTMTDNLPSSDPAVQMSKKAGSKEYPYVNDHDKRPEELYADLNGAKNARVRTKYWGRKSSGKNYKNKLNNGTRNINNQEIEKVFNNLSENMKKIHDSIKNKMLQQVEKKITALKESLNNGILTEEAAECLYMTMLEKQDKVDTFIKTMAGDKSKRYLLSNDIVMCKAGIKQSKRNIEYLKQQLETADKHERDELQEMLDYHIQRMEKFLQDIESINKRWDKLSGQYEPNDLLYFNSLRDNEKVEISKMYMHMVKSELDNSQLIYKQLQAMVTSAETCMDTSTKLRYDFVMKYKNNIQEYFTNFFNEYYSLEYLFE